MAGINKSGKLTDSYHQPDFNKDADIDNGIYLATVINNKDEFLNGSLLVEIPGLHKTSGSKVKTIKKVKFSTPFGGISNTKNVKPDETEKFENTQQSYGMWFSPPDVGSQVLVAFAEGNRKYGYVISHVLPDQFNNMLPGIPAGKSFQGGKFKTPVAEKNKYSEQQGFNDILSPIHHDLAEAVTKQGLINDTIRGVGTSGARRETPSMVTGILTKGARGKDGITPVYAGHQFIMDDHPDSAMIRLRSGKGQQILLDDVTGTIYMINKDGRGWLEIDMMGNINVFGEGDINLRAKKNFNLRADYDVNIEAGQNVRIKAAGDNIGGDYKGSKLSKIGMPPLGSGGKINLHAAADIGMLATRNAQLSAIGGDIDINCGNMLKTASGTATSITSTTVGVDIKAVAGIVGIGAPSVGITSPLTGISGGIINLNTGPAPLLTGLEANKISADSLDGNEVEDQPSDAPEYDREGDVALTSGGKRPGNKQKISTIVGTLLTAEPYVGHSQYDPTTEDQDSMEEDATADAEALPGQTSPGDDNPAEVNTPEGTKLGNGFKDPVSGAVGTATDVANAIGNGLDSAGAALGNAIGDITSMIPNMADLQGMISNFLPASLQNLASINNMSGLMAAMGIAIPAFRFPTANAKADKIIGMAKQLKEIEARIGQFSLDMFDLPIDIEGLDVSALKGKVMDAVNTATDVINKAEGLQGKLGDLKTHADKLKSLDPRDAIDPVSGYPMGSMGINGTNFPIVKAELEKKGVDLTVDGPSLIFTDRKTGTKVIDVSNGIGPAGQQMALVSDLNYAKREISQLITVPISENQTLALVSFATHIGINNFANSELLVELNKGNYAEVPKYMKRWRTGKVGSESLVQVRQDYVQRREYEIELFTTPDWLKLTHAEMGIDKIDKNLSFGQLRAMLKFAKDRKYVELGYRVN